MTTVSTSAAPRLPMPYSQSSWSPGVGAWGIVGPSQSASGDGVGQASRTK